MNDCCRIALLLFVSTSCLWFMASLCCRLRLVLNRSYFTDGTFRLMTGRRRPLWSRVIASRMSSRTGPEGFGLVLFVCCWVAVSFWQLLPQLILYHQKLALFFTNKLWKVFYFLFPVPTALSLATMGSFWAWSALALGLANFSYHSASPHCGSSAGTWLLLLL